MIKKDIFNKRKLALELGKIRGICAAIRKDQGR